MTKEVSGTDLQFITCRQIEVWRDDGGGETLWVNNFYQQEFNHGTESHDELSEEVFNYS